MVLNAMDCCGGVGYCGSKQWADDQARQRLATAGLVRFVEQAGSLQRWHAEDSAVLALLVGTVARPVLD